MELRICTGQYSCGQEKPLIEENFRLDKRHNYFDKTCIECRNKKSRENHSLNRERDNNKLIKYNKKHRNSEIGRNSRFKSAGYKLNGQEFTVNNYNELFLKQKGKCAICKEDLVEGRFTHVDHNHKTGEVRKLLCNNCNQGLGKFKDSINLLNSAINYLILYK